MALTNHTSAGPRKTLATQLDRLDSILDGLSEGLSEAVATAVQQAVIEVMTNAELERLLHPPAPQSPTPPYPTPPPAQKEEGTGRGGLLQGVLGVARRTWAAARSAAGSAWARVQAVARGTGQLAAAGMEQVRHGACGLYGLLLTSHVAKAVAVGGLAAVACYASGSVASALGRLAAAVPGLLANVSSFVLSFFHGG